MKKDPNRYCIRFYDDDPIHKEAMEILDGAGRRKADLIANAVVRLRMAAASPMPLPDVTPDYFFRMQASPQANSTMDTLSRQTLAQSQQSTQAQPQSSLPSSSSALSDVAAYKESAGEDIGNDTMIPDTITTVGISKYLKIFNEDDKRNILDGMKMFED